MWCNSSVRSLAIVLSSRCTRPTSMAGCRVATTRPLSDVPTPTSAPGEASSSQTPQRADPRREGKPLTAHNRAKVQISSIGTRPGGDEFVPRTSVPPLSEQKSFATLLRRSKLMQLGDVNGRIVVGKIEHIMDDDLYIDFGGKFNCVCKRPEEQSASYVNGAHVRLRLHDLELSSRFLGSERDLTLLEADATLLGLYSK